MKAKPTRSPAIAVVGKLTSAELRELCGVLVALLPPAGLAKLEVYVRKLELRVAARRRAAAPARGAASVESARA